MGQSLTSLAAILTVFLGACVDLGTSHHTGAVTVASPPAITAQPPPGVRLRSPAEALLADSVVGAPHIAGSTGSLTAAQAASQQPDQAAALAEFVGWGWLGGATRSWSGVDEMIVLTARADGATRAFAAWSADTGQDGYSAAPCSAAEGAGVDECRLGLAGGRALVVARLGTAVFRIACPASEAERLTVAQVAALHA
jgi:hypothetical protein